MKYIVSYLTTEPGCLAPVQNNQIVELPRERMEIEAEEMVQEAVLGSPFEPKCVAWAFRAKEA